MGFFGLFRESPTLKEELPLNENLETNSFSFSMAVRALAQILGVEVSPNDMHVYIYQL